VIGVIFCLAILALQAPGRFWDITATSIVTWIAIVFGFIGARYIEFRLLAQRITIQEAWRVAHELETEKMQATIVSLSNNMAQLTALLQSSEQRLRRLEDWQDDNR